MGYAQDADQILLINEVKKALYKQKPLAHRFFMGKYQYQFKCDVFLNEMAYPFSAIFTVPIEEMGETEFTDSMPAQLLIRWLDIA